jgi:hypothetical protein
MDAVDEFPGFATAEPPLGETREGRPTTRVYFVESGRIRCTSSASDGRELSAQSSARASSSGSLRR